MFRFLIPILFLIGCATTKPTYETKNAAEIAGLQLALFQNNSPYADQEKVLAVVAITERHLNIDLHKVAITVDNWSDEFYCQGHDSCTHHIHNNPLITTHIFVPWRPDHGEEAAAELLAHELCHVYMIQTTGDGDHFHEHLNYFARSNGQYGGSKDNVGLATIIAREYMTEYGEE